MDIIQLLEKLQMKKVSQDEYEIMVDDNRILISANLLSAEDFNEMFGTDDAKLHGKILFFDFTLNDSYMFGNADASAYKIIGALKEALNQIIAQYSGNFDFIGYEVLTNSARGGIFSKILGKLGFKPFLEKNKSSFKVVLLR